MIHAYEALLRLHEETDEGGWIAQQEIVDECNRTRGKIRKEFTCKMVGSIVVSIVAAGWLERRRTIKKGIGITEYRIVETVDWTQVEIRRKPVLETWAGMMTQNAGTN